jgi:hypothetical protein
LTEKPNGNSVQTLTESDDKNMDADEVESENGVESKQQVERRFQNRWLSQYQWLRSMPFFRIS